MFGMVFFFSPVEQFTILSFLCVLLASVLSFLWMQDFLKGHFQPARAVFTVVLFLGSFCFSHLVLGFKIDQCLLKMSYGLAVVILAKSVSPFFVASTYFQEILRDQKTLQTHWKEDNDLKLLTIVLRTFRLLVFFFFLIGVYLFPIGLELALPNTPSFQNSLTPWEFCITAGPLCWLLAIALLLVIETIQLGATMHIIWCRNTSTVHKMMNLCIECAKSTGFMIGGAGSIGVGVLHGLSSTPFIPPTPFGNAWQAYSFLGRGYGFETLAVHQRHVVLESCPSYDATTLANESRIVTEAAQEQFVKTHSAEVCKHTSMAQRQLVNIHPSFGGFVKACLFQSK